jgi:hypothetical protein
MLRQGKLTETLENIWNEVWEMVSDAAEQKITIIGQMYKKRLLKPSTFNPPLALCLR